MGGIERTTACAAPCASACAAFHTPAPAPLPTCPPAKHAPPSPPPLQALLKASSPGAEALNGRLAMLAFVGVAGLELGTGRSLVEQLASPSGAAHAAALGLAVMAASLAPVLAGRVRPEQAFPSEASWGPACLGPVGGVLPCRGLRHLRTYPARAAHAAQCLEVKPKSSAAGRAPTLPVPMPIPPMFTRLPAERLVRRHPAVLLLDRPRRDHCERFEAVEGRGGVAVGLRPAWHVLRCA